ncbi:MAG: precorrin-3B C(17)-methyltransferase [Lyngbya sp. HA4199-MV5]|jgi:cobalt-precorrin 5A hydrolase/precorrin-3B C17-methyltransferase|nr:precorrin-3B C(17)-methyltransferase [Lyngbya sp. HA4199-MV5]
MKPPVIIILSESSVAIAQQIQVALPNAMVYGLAGRVQSVDVSYTKFGDTVRDLFSNGTPIVGICAAGILIRSLAPLLTDKRAEPPVIAVAEDGSAVVPLLGGLTGANELASTIAHALEIKAAITATGQLRFNVVLEAPPPGYRLTNPDHAKAFTSDLIAGATVKLIGDAPWLSQSNLPFRADGTHTIEVTDRPIAGSATHLVYQPMPVQGKLAIVGTGPGAAEWMSPETRALLQAATDLVGYKTYLDLVGTFAQGKRHESDNRVELDRARHALDLAAEGRSVVVVSSGDPGIYAMASAVFEVLDREAKPAWEALEIHVAPGISAMQAAAAAIGAPLGHDFCAISLSDILKPWSVIEQRIALAAQADFVLAFYNPVSKQRTWQLDRAKEILLHWRSPATPVVLARNLGRSGQSINVKPLADLTSTDADMRTVILIGSSKTRLIERSDGGVWVYTPRHYGG